MNCNKLASALALAALLAGCGGSRGQDGSAQTSAPRATASSAPAPAAPTAPPNTKDAASLAAALGQGTPHIWTAETDPNKLLGRPGGYTSAATVADKRVSCDDPKEPGASCGATVEVFASAEDAKARSDYIQSILRGGGLLGTEYHTRADAALPRVAGELTPKQAAVYAEKFKAAAAS